MGHSLHSLRHPVAVVLAVASAGIAAASQAPVLRIELDPADSLAPMAAQRLDTARVVLTRRYQYALHGRSEVAVEKSKLRVLVFDGRDRELGVVLATRAGSVAYYDSPQPIDTGTMLAGNAAPVLVSADVADTRAVESEFEPPCELTIRLTDEGAKKLGAYSVANVGHSLVLARDGRVLRSSVIMTSLGQVLRVGGMPSGDSLRALNAELRGGSLPVELKVGSLSIPPEARTASASAVGLAEEQEGLSMRLSRVVHSIPYDVVSLLASLASLVMLYRAWRRRAVNPAGIFRAAIVVGLVTLIVGMPRWLVSRPEVVQTRQATRVDCSLKA